MPYQHNRPQVLTTSNIVFLAACLVFSRRRYVSFRYCPNHHSPLHSICSTFSFSKVLIPIWAGGALIWEVFPGNGGWVNESGMNCLLCTWHCVTDMLPSSSLLYWLAHSDLFFVFIIFLFSYSCFPKCQIHVSLFVKYDQK